MLTFFLGEVTGSLCERTFFLAFFFLGFVNFTVGKVLLLGISLLTNHTEMENPSVAD